MSEKKAFFAYQSYPPDLSETLENAIETINESAAGMLYVRSWKSLEVTGNFIVNEILSNIDNSDLFICDLTYLNFNVLFELGYAIAKRKKIWIVLNPSVSTAKRDLDKLQMLTTVGYATYTNSQEIVKEFFNDAPYERLDKTILDEVNYVPADTKRLLYLKSSVNTDAALHLSVRLENIPLPTLVDDPSEGIKQPLQWYIQNLVNSHGVIAHFLSETHTDYISQNAKNSLVSGIAKGLDIPLLMLAHGPFNSPIDYRDILKVHNTASQCESFIDTWVTPIVEKYNETKENFRAHLKDQKAISELNRLFVGQPIAEHEAEQLLDYFFETREYDEALNSQQTLFIGRKGTGKTANLLKISDELRKDKRNFVCTVRPFGHEIDGVLNMLMKSIPRSEKSYLVESIWKFLIFTELAKSVYQAIKAKHSYLPKSEEEEELISFVESNEKLINADFTLRLENALKTLCMITDSSSIESHRVKVSEILHNNIISKLRMVLGDVLHEKNKVCILIDNLDASWNSRDDIRELCELLLGLLRVSREIADNFQGADYRQKKVNLSLIAFLRSDIFSQVLSYANERDKLEYSKLLWNDPELLFRVIENRMQYSIDTIPSPKELWQKYFCKDVQGIALREYVSQLIIPRPRDIIFLFRAAIQEAVNRGHSMVLEEDFLSAEFKYSQYALESLSAENGNRVEDLESLLYEFAGETAILSHSQVIEILNRVSEKNDHKELIEFLCELTFLGLEVREDTFDFLNEKREKRIVYRLAEKTALIYGEQRYKINKAFHSYLDISDNSIESRRHS